jgi:hypothetical protein
LSLGFSSSFGKKNILEYFRSRIFLKKEPLFSENYLVSENSVTGPSDRVKSSFDAVSEVYT